MSTLYIHLPCKATFDLTLNNRQDLACPFALLSDNDAVELESIASLTDLSATIAKAQHIIVLLAASDVTLLQVSLPPLSSAKLKLALPNLVEDQILGSAADNVIVAGGVSNGLRTLAIVQRAWLEQIRKIFNTLGAKQLNVLPAQLCLPHQTGRAVAAIRDADLTLRLSAQIGMGVALSTPQPEAVIESVRAFVPELPIVLHVPKADVSAYQAAIHHAELTARISIVADSASLWVSGARDTTLNLMSGLVSDANMNINWRPWRGSLILAAAILLINIVALNCDWWQLNREAKNLRATLTQIYQARFPDEKVVIDPIAQMQQKISFAKRDAGLAVPDDFIVLAANFGAAWAAITAASKPAVASLEYREQRLFVRFKVDANPPDDALVQQVESALGSHHLSLTDSSAETWQIRSAP
ncbi:MAG: type II secretion system protein GspL [Gallionella sp.]